MNRSLNKDIKKIILDVFKSNHLIFLPELDDEEILNENFDISFQELGMDSLAKMEIIIWLEIEYGIEINEIEMDNLKSLNGLSIFLSNYLHSKPSK